MHTLDTKVLYEKKICDIKNQFTSQITIILQDVF